MSSPLALVAERAPTLARDALPAVLAHLRDARVEALAVAAVEAARTAARVVEAEHGDARGVPVARPLGARVGALARVPEQAARARAVEVAARHVRAQADPAGGAVARVVLLAEGAIVVAGARALEGVLCRHRAGAVVLTRCAGGRHQFKKVKYK